MSIQSVPLDTTDVALSYFGPPLEEGPLPAALYFALSAEDSLTLDPFNQPVAPFVSMDMRVFSFTIPGHEPPHQKEHAIEYWDKCFAEENDILTPFFDGCAAGITELITKRVIDPKALAGMGLSRGGFCLLHIASRVLELKRLCLFAPLLHKYTEHFSFDIPTLCERTIRMYIGNKDTRVGTEHTIALHQKLVRANNTTRSIPQELRITPSIGYKGHGTSRETFEEGAEWILRGLTSI